MKFGCCLNMIATGEDGTGAEFIEQLAETGYDYAELPLAQMMELSDVEFGQLKRRLHKAGLECQVCNNFFPADYRLTGEHVAMTSILNYVEGALERANQLGGKVVVFGSGPAKQVPEGFPIEEGYRQIVCLLKEVDKIAQKHGIIIAIEPLRREECNLINTFEEGCALARDVQGVNIKVLVDFYHLSEEKEPVEHLLKEGKEYLAHVHFAKPAGRTYPETMGEADYRPFIQALQEIEYKGRVSCEAYTNNFKESASKALCFFKQYFK